MKLGEIIREYRLINKMSMGDFAKVSGLSKPYVSMLEANKNSNGGKPIIPSVETLRKVSTTVGISLDELLRKLGDEKIDLRPPTFSLEETQLVDNYREMNAEDKDFLWDIVRRLLNRNSTVAAVNPTQNNFNNSGDIKNNFVAYGGHNSVKQNVTMN